MDLEDITKTTKDLREFETEIAYAFKSGSIHSPVHFSHGNEEQLIKIFRGLREEEYIRVDEAVPLTREKSISNGLIEVSSDVSPSDKIFSGIQSNDWICSSYRSHYHALLKGISREWVKDEILEGRSMYLMNSEHKLVTTAIVPGQIAIALGIARGAKLRNASEHVWAFCGDMASETGIFEECSKYAEAHKFPLTLVIEDNGLSVDTPTYTVWNTSPRRLRGNTIRYTYKSGVPHQGIGKEVGF